MKSPADQKIIQIDITNSCTHRCSNCTRFCGHHRKTFMMEEQTFKSAVDSLEGFPGMEQWEPDQRVLLHEAVIHIPHGTEGTNWAGRKSPPLGARKLEK